MAVYQGENMYVQDNKQLAELMVPLPRNNKSHEPFTVTFTYDINSILGVALRVAAEGSDYVRDYLRVDLRFCKQLEF